MDSSYSTKFASTMLPFAKLSEYMLSLKSLPITGSTELLAETVLSELVLDHHLLDNLSTSQPTLKPTQSSSAEEPTKLLQALSAQQPQLHPPTSPSVSKLIHTTQTKHLSLISLPIKPPEPTISQLLKAVSSDSALVRLREPLNGSTRTCLSTLPTMDPALT